MILPSATTASVGEPGDRFALARQRLAAEDEARSRWLSEFLRREPPKSVPRFKRPGHLCAKGHPLDGVQTGRGGRKERICTTCRRERKQRDAAKRRGPCALGHPRDLRLVEPDGSVRWRCRECLNEARKRHRARQRAAKEGT